MRTTTGGLTIWVDEPDVLRIRLDRPERRNAQTPQMWEDLLAVASDVPEGIRFIVIDGTDPDFSAGLDRSLLDPAAPVSLTSLAMGSEEGLDDFLRHAQAAFRIWRTVPAHVIACVSGNAIGAGFQLALAADILVVHPAARLVLRETSLGIIPDLGASATLIPCVGYSRTVALLGGLPITGEQAYDWGIAALVSDDPQGAVGGLVSVLREANPGALAATKEVARAVLEGAEPWETERRAQIRQVQALVAGMGR